MRRLVLAVLAACAAGLAYAVAAHPYGARFALGDWPVPGGTPWTYQLESGFIPALTVLTLLGSAASLYHLHNCHEPRCPRLGKHKVNGTPWCSVHQEKARPELTVENLLQTLIGRIDALAGAPDAHRAPRP